MKVVPQPIGKKHRTQRPSQYQPIETRQRSRDLVLMLRDKLVHGASALLGCSPLSAEQSYERLKRLPFLVAATPRCAFVVKRPHPGHATASANPGSADDNSSMWALAMPSSSRASTPLTVVSCWPARYSNILM